MVTPAGKRKAVAHLRAAFGMSERRACKAIGCCRMTMRYQTTRMDDAGLRQRMRAIAQERRRFGYRRLHVLLKREGYVINHKKLFRLYREEKLARVPESELSATSAKHSRVQSSTVRTRKRRPQVSWSDTKSSDQRSLGAIGTSIGARVPIARLRPPRRRTASFSSR